MSEEEVIALCSNDECGEPCGDPPLISAFSGDYLCYECFEQEERSVAP